MLSRYGTLVSVGEGKRGALLGVVFVLPSPCALMLWTTTLFELSDDSAKEVLWGEVCCVLVRFVAMDPSCPALPTRRASRPSVLSRNLCMLSNM